MSIMSRILGGDDEHAADTGEMNARLSEPGVTSDEIASAHTDAGLDNPSYSGPMAVLKNVLRKRN